MAEITTPTWRQALSERAHPLYEAAWVIFKMHSVEYATEYLNDRKDEVLPLLSEILNTDELYLNDGFGEGRAPVNVIRLIGEWKLSDYLPKLLEILADTPEQRPAYSAALNTVVGLGEAVIEPVLAWVADDETLRPEASKVLRRVGQGNAAVFDAIKSWIDINDVAMLHTYTNYLIDLDPKRAEMVIYDLSRNRELPKEDQKRLKAKVNEARKRHQSQKALEATAHLSAIEVLTTLEEMAAAEEAEIAAQAAEEAVEEVVEETAENDAE